MCRIAGLINNHLQPAEINSIVNTMCNTMQHGGPDDAGIFVNEDAKLAFGHRRLSIIDLSKNGHQPMADAANKAWITFNGEIYNYPELRHQLIALGARFNSNTDTEVIIQAYLYWGTASFAKLRGIFAFALYDTATKNTFLVRDTNGIKPLYYFIQNGQLSFASEVKAFKAAKIAVNNDERWPVWLLAFGNIPEPYTTLKGVLSLPKGHYLSWDKAGNYAINNYSLPRNLDSISDIKAATEGIYSHLRDAVNRQLIADASIGVFLSGGIDSSILTLLANQKQGQLLKTVSIFFDEKTYDERAYQNAVVNKLTGDCHTHLVKQQDFEDNLPQILRSMDIPTTDGINSWFISKYAREAGLKAVLSGIGADELLGGYPSFNRIKYLGFLRRFPAGLFKGVGVISNSYKRLIYLAHNNHIADYLFLRGLYTPGDIARILDTDEKQVNDILFTSYSNMDLGPYNKLHAAWFETNMYMQNQLLRDTDVMSMSHGLEVRVPFLDEDFRQFVNSIDPAIRFNSGRPKKLLIDSFKSILPKNVWNRPKMGFSFPLQEWMRQNNKIANEELYKGAMAKTLIKKFKEGEIHWSRAFALYQIQEHV
jgi:asparagine synthase (glutamine-hydrolysing)